MSLSDREYRYQKRYRLDQARGVDRSTVPAGSVLAHVESLIAAGATQAGIARAAGVSPTTISRLRQGRMSTMQRRAAGSILRVTITAVLGRPDPDGFVPRLGAVRRVRALQAMGWSYEAMGEHTPGNRWLARNVVCQPGEWITRDTHDQIVALYDRLAMTHGPSAITGRRAARAGHAPPLAWDDDAIDDPAARPVEIARPGAGTRLLDGGRITHDAVRHLAHDESLTIQQAADRMEVSRNYLDRWLSRYDHDRALRDRFARNRIVHTHRKETAA